MKEKEAMEILESHDMLTDYGRLYCSIPLVDSHAAGSNSILLDGGFTPEMLRAIAWWIDNKQEVNEL